MIKSSAEFASMMERFSPTTAAETPRLAIKEIRSKKNLKGEIVSRFKYHENLLSPKAQAAIETIRALIRVTTALAQNLNETDLEHVRLVLNEGWDA